MRKELFDNILKCGTRATSDDFSPEDKRRIYETMQEKGMSDGTAYNRFFRDGFDKWELRGIRRIIDQFAYENQLDFDSYETFYKHLANKSLFKQRMKEFGMGNTTVICRFSGFNFKPWEMEGIESIILVDLIDA